MNRPTCAACWLRTRKFFDSKFGSVGGQCPYLPTEPIFAGHGKKVRNRQPARDLILATYSVNHSMADTGSLQKVSQVLTVFLRSLAQVPHITGKLRAVAF